MREWLHVLWPISSKWKYLVFLEKIKRLKVEHNYIHDVTYLNICMNMGCREVGEGIFQSQHPPFLFHCHHYSSATQYSNNNYFHMRSLPDSERLGGRAEILVPPCLVLTSWHTRMLA